MVKRCANGHYYDGDRFPECPYCGSKDTNESSGVTVSVGGVEKMFSEPAANGDDMKTITLGQSAEYMPQNNYIDDDDDATIPVAPPMMNQQPEQFQAQMPEQQAPDFVEESPVMENIPYEQPQYSQTEEFAVPMEQAVTMPLQQSQETQVFPAPPVPETPFVPEPVQPANTMQGSFSELVNNAMRNPARSDDTPTVSVYGSRMKSEPTVGWLIGISAPYLGECFELRTGKNFIGRGQDMDIVLASDTTVSRYRHAVVLYEPKARIFLAQPGDSRELFYINDKVVLNNQPLEAYDKLTIGETKLMFFPLCSSEFSWDDVEKDN